MDDVSITLSLRELETIINTMRSYAALHISANYEAEELTERLENMLTAFEVTAYD